MCIESVELNFKVKVLSIWLVFGDTVVGNEEKEDASDKNVDVMARSPLKQAPLDTENAEDTSKAYKKMHSKEASAKFI